MPTTPLCFCFVSASSLFVSQVCTSLDREPAIEVNGADWPVFVITKAFSTFYIFLFYWLFRHLISSVSVQCSSKSSSSETISAQKNCWSTTDASFLASVALQPPSPNNQWRCNIILPASPSAPNNITACILFNGSATSST